MVGEVLSLGGALTTWSPQSFSVQMCSKLTGIIEVSTPGSAPSSEFSGNVDSCHG